MDTKKKSKNLDGIIPSHWLKGDGESSKSSKNLSPSDRVKIIEKAFEDILCREPDTRDLNYYKYSSMQEEEIRQDLIESDEHTKLVKNGREYKKTKNLLENAESRISSLQREIEDKEAGLKHMEDLLKEKNLHIEELKKKIKCQFESN